MKSNNPGRLERKIKSRDVRLDFMRVLAALAVVLLHVTANVINASPDPGRWGWWVINVGEAFSRWCVPMFVMVSGALLLNVPHQASPGHFYRKRAFRLLPALLFWTLIYLAFKYFTESPFTLSEAAQSVLWGTPYYHLWYLYMIVGLYLVTPFLREIVAACTLSKLWVLTGLCLALAAIETPLGGASATFLTRFLPFIGYYLAGYLLYRHPPKVLTRWLVLSIAVAVTLISLWAALALIHQGPRGLGQAYSSHNPLVVLLSLSAFLLLLTVRKIAPPWVTLINRLASVALGIYLVHPLWLWWLGQHRINGLSIHPIIGIPATTVIAFVLAALTAGLLAKVPGLKRMVQ